MNRYLTPTAAKTILSIGDTIEQWLGARMEGGTRVLRWLSIGPHHSHERYLVRVSEVLDDGSDDFIDVYEFTQAEPDSDHTTSFASKEDALKFAIETCGARPDHFVREGIVQLEYQDFRKASGLQMD